MGQDATANRCRVSRPNPPRPPSSPSLTQQWHLRDMPGFPEQAGASRSATSQPETHAGPVIEQPPPPFDGNPRAQGKVTTASQFFSCMKMFICSACFSSHRCAQTRVPRYMSWQCFPHPARCRSSCCDSAPHPLRFLLQA